MRRENGKILLLEMKQEEMNSIKSQRLSELAKLLYAEEDQENERAKAIARTITICSMNDARWWEQHAEDAEELIRFYNRPPPRRLPPIPYEDWPS